MNQKSTALLFSTVWPEPESSAAGVRQLQWVRLFQSMEMEVVLSSPSKSQPQWKSGDALGITCLPLPLNRSEIKEELKKLNPAVVMFDRFLLEEQFGHFVYETCPDALILMETQDLHFVRRAREALRASYLTTEKLPEDFYRTDTAIRETASIKRVDYSYLVSSFEERLLWEEFFISAEQVQWVPFSYPEPIIERSYRSIFSERRDFSWIGNFRHAPNMDGLRWFLKEIWPGIRKALPETHLHLYGAYPTSEVMGWSGDGVISHGPAKSLDDVFLRARVNLAPLRFGAGVKGKILEGFRYGLPCVTTKVGVEGLLPLHAEYMFPGLEANDAGSFIESAIELYKNEELWNEKRFAMLELLDEVYTEADLFPRLRDQIEELITRKKMGKLPTWNSQILRHELQNSHKYFSKWIELKESINAPKL